MSNKVAVVTGSNKGIGYAIVKELCQRHTGVVYLTARDVARGTEAVTKLRQEGLNPQFHQLEVTDYHNVKAFANYLKDKHGGLDILINNAAVVTKDHHETTYEDSSRVVEVNYEGLLIVQECLFPILRDKARVINITSNCGHISNIKNVYWINRLTKEDIELDDIDDFLEWFLESVRNGTMINDDFEQTSILAYRISKIAVCALTRVQAKKMDRGISVNSLHPGFVQTDLTNNVGDLTADAAAKAPVYLALDVDQAVTGKFFWFDKTEKDWTDPNLKLYDNFETFEQYLKNAGVQ